ncbi:MAG: nucleotidyl transferase AbiEii/AbiGii toxin family protein [Bdellovibrionales bacterium]|nr:nucleotidyl transferase AbiEii/AbiGii toxin family protein [Bdellovibrionales bacterium]
MDASIERDFLGFDENKNPQKLSTRSQQRSILENLSKASSKHIQNERLPNLSASVAAKLKTSDGWQILNDADDSGGQTLLFEYPSITPKGGYIRPFVKIEMGARAEHWPVSDHPVQSYAKEALIDQDTRLMCFLGTLRFEIHESTGLLYKKTNPMRKNRDKIS